MKRPTISEIATRAGVSIGAVSYALNGRPGVSDLACSVNGQYVKVSTSDDSRAGTRGPADVARPA